MAFKQRFPERKLKNSVHIQLQVWISYTEAKLPFSCISAKGKPLFGSISVRGDFMQFQRIEDLRIDSDKTQAQVAAYLGCQREVYRRYEKGTRQIPVDFLIRLSDLYDVSTDYILALTDEKKPYPRKKK